MQAPPPNPPTNLGLFILLGFCFRAAVVDRWYKRFGGTKPTKFERVALLATILGCVPLIFIIALGSPEAAGTTLTLLTVTVFGFWEIDRYRIRRKNPIGNMKSRIRGRQAT